MKWISGLLIGIIFATAGTAWGASCTVTTMAAHFGNYDPIGTAPSDTVTVINVKCAAGIAYNLKADSGQNSTAGFQRRMSSSAVSTLNYNLYRDSTLSELWGDGTGTTFAICGTGAGGPVQHMVFGRIPGGQKVRAGTYIDSIIVTVEW